MAYLDEEKIKKLKRGETAGHIAAALCGVVLVYFISAFAAAQAFGLHILRLVTLIVSPILAAICIVIFAYCKVKYGSPVKKIISDYIRSVLAENASLLHTNRSSLTFFIDVTGSKVNLKVNAYKEKIIFDFSSLGKLSFFRKGYIVTELITRLAAMFFGLYEQGANFKSIDFSVATSDKPETGDIIVDGKPEKNAYEKYLKKKTNGRDV